MVQAEGEGAFVPDKPGNLIREGSTFYSVQRANQIIELPFAIWAIPGRGTLLDQKDDFLLNILGLSKVYTKVIGIIPSHQVMAEFEAWLDHISEFKSLRSTTLDLKDATIYSPRPIHGGIARRDGRHQSDSFALIIDSAIILFKTAGSSIAPAGNAHRDQL